MTEPTKTRFPAPLYAAAGAGDLAYQQLRKLPAVINELSDRATASLKTVNETAGVRAGSLREKAATADLDKLRSNATNSAVALAQVAQDRALALYTALVARGERVVGTGVVEAADVVNADMVTTEQPKAVEAAEDADTAEAGDAKTAPKARKRTRPAGE
jgi:heparin binding hemagglutinin HbhA